MHIQGRGRSNSNRRRGGFRRYQCICVSVSIILVIIVYRYIQDDETVMHRELTLIDGNRLVQGEWRDGTVKITKLSDTKLPDNQTELNRHQQGTSLDIRHGNDTNKDIDIDRYNRVKPSLLSDKNTSDLGEHISSKLDSNQMSMDVSNITVNATLTSKSVGSTLLDRNETRKGNGMNRTNIQMDKTLPNTGGETKSRELIKKRGNSSEYVTGVDWASDTDRATIEGIASDALKLANVAQSILLKNNTSLSTQTNSYIGNKTQLVEDFVANAQHISKIAKEMLSRIKYHEAKDTRYKMNNTKLVQGFAAAAKTFANLPMK